jgi:hypothetical protein
MQTLPLRTTEPPLTGITVLQIDAVPQPNGLPGLTAQLARPTGHAFIVTLRIHNQAGIPIIEAHSRLAAGADTLIFSELTPLGIEAYAHAPAERRLEVAQRVWSRRAYAVLRCSPM